jgi:hypothetical protein
LPQPAPASYEEKDRAIQTAAAVQTAKRNEEIKRNRRHADEAAAEAKRKAGAGLKIGRDESAENRSLIN